MARPSALHTIQRVHGARDGVLGVQRRAAGRHETLREMTMQTNSSNSSKPRHTVLVTQTAFAFAPDDRVEPLTGDRTRLARITVEKWSKVTRKTRRALKVVTGTFERRRNLGTTARPVYSSRVVVRRLRWTANGECVVVDGSAAHAEVRALLAEHRLGFTERADAGRWCVVGGQVLLRCPEIVDGATARDLLPIGMPVLALRGDTWTRWRGAPKLWPYDRVLIAQLARCA